MMNIFYLALGLVIWGGAILCGGASLVSLFTRRWKFTGILWSLYLGFIGIIFLLMWLNDPYARNPVAPSEVVGTYRLSSSGAQRLEDMGYQKLKGTFKLNGDGTCSADEIPAFCVNGQVVSVSRFTEGYFSFSGLWTIERSSDVYVVKIKWTKLEPSAGAGRSDLPSDVSIHILNGRPNSLAFSIFNGSDFDDIVYVPVSSRSASSGY